MALSIAASSASSFWWCQALNHTQRTPKRPRSSFSRPISELLPLPQSPVMAMVSGASVRSLRRNADRPQARGAKSRRSSVIAASGRSEAKASAMVSSTRVSGVGGGRMAAAPRETKPSNQASHTQGAG
ncbi:hypothetical protein D9M71_168490 [compost metagenome]